MNNLGKKSRVASSISLAIATLMASPLIAAESDYELEKITVTASKRVENLQDVASAVTALSAKDLVNSQITRTEDLVNLSPSLTFQSGGSDNASSFNIRGIGTQSYSSGVEPSIATVIDGVIMGRSGMAFNELLDVQRVEVLRGPQGMLFGKNASGGVVQIITNDPGDTFEAAINSKAILSGTDEYRVSGMVSMPVSDTLGIRVAAFTTERDDHINNVFNDRDVNGSKNKGGRVKIKWQPTDDLSVKWSSDFSERSGECCQPQPRSATPTEAFFLGAVSASEDNDSINVSAELYNESESWGHSLEANWELGEYTLTSISAYRDYSSKSNQDVDGTPQTLLDINAGESNQTQQTQELRLTSPQNQTLTYVVGLYYFEQRMNRDFQRVYHDIFGNFVPTFPGLKFGSHYEATVDSISYAGFGQFEVNISDTFRLLGGARYTNEQLDFEFEREQAAGVYAPIVANQAMYQDSTKDTDFSFKVGAQWDMNKDVMSYVTLTEGYKGPAFNVIFEMTSDNTLPVAPETSKAIEVGIKSRLFNNHLVLNTALFQSNYDNFQAQAQDANSSAFTLLNAGEVRTRGIEVDFQARPNEDMMISGGLAYIDAQIVDFKGGPCSPRQVAINENSCGGNSQDLSGKDLPFSPNVKFNLSVEYFMPLGGDHELVPRATYRWQGDELFSMDQDKEKSQDAYGVLDISVRLESLDQSYSVTLFVNNALDENYVDAIIHNNIWAGSYDHFYSAKSERTAGIDFRYTW
jgi:iron complex outermembrane receptor protein